jgi:hypothetical protein
MLSDAADARGLDQGLAAALMNLAWAAGQIGGSGVGGAAAKAVGDGLPVAVAAALCAGTLVVIAARPPIAVARGEHQPPANERPVAEMIGTASISPTDRSRR